MLVSLSLAPLPSLPSTLQFALGLLNQGGAGLYDRISDQLSLPSISQLLNYKGFTACGSGWHPPVMEQAAELVKMAGAQPDGGLAFDEMKISSGLVFNISTNSFLGYSDVDVGTEAQRLHQLLGGKPPLPSAAGAAAMGGESAPPPALATHVLHLTYTTLGPQTVR